MTSTRGKLGTGWATKAPTAPKQLEKSSSSVAPSAGTKQRRPKGSGEEIGINLRMSPEAWTAFGVLAAKQRRAKQDLLLEALDLLLAHYGEEPVARPRLP